MTRLRWAAGMLLCGVALVLPAVVHAQSLHVLDRRQCDFTGQNLATHFSVTHRMNPPAAGQPGYAFGSVIVFAEESDCGRVHQGALDACTAVRGDCSSIPKCTLVQLGGAAPGGSTGAIELAIAQYMSTGRVDPMVGNVAAMQAGFAAGAAFDNWIKQSASRARQKALAEQQERDLQRRKVELTRQRERDSMVARLSAQMKLATQDAVSLRVDSPGRSLDLGSLKMGDSSAASAGKPVGMGEIRTGATFDGDRGAYTRKDDTSAEDLVRGRPRDCTFGICRDPRGNYVETPVDLRRAVFLARQTRYALAADAEVLWGQAMNAAAGDSSLQAVRVPADVPSIDTASLRRFRETSLAYRQANDLRVKAVAESDEAAQRRTLAAELARAAKEDADAPAGVQLADKRQRLATMREHERQAAAELNAANALLAKAEAHVAFHRDRTRDHIRYLAVSLLRPTDDANGKPLLSAEPVVWKDRVLVGGTTWTFGGRLNCGTDCRAAVTGLLYKQLDLYCTSNLTVETCKKPRGQRELPFNPDHYDLIVSVGSSHDAAADIASRVLFDHVDYGKHSAENQPAFVNLKGNVEKLDCHSNGAMVCLAALRAGDVRAKEVRLFGPQMSEEAAARWAELAAGGMKVTVYAASGDPVLGASWTLPQTEWKLKGVAVAGASLVAKALPVAGLIALTGTEGEFTAGVTRLVGSYLLPKQTQDARDGMKKLGMSVVTLPCAWTDSTGRPKAPVDATSINLDCHSAKMYEENANRYERGRAMQIRDSLAKRPPELSPH